MIKRTVKKIKRLIDFAPIIWNGNDYDYGSAVNLFTFQLSRLADHLDSENSYAVNASKHAKEIRLTVSILNKLRDDHYCDETYDELDSHFGKVEIKFIPESDNYYSEYYTLEQFRDGEPIPESERAVRRKKIMNAHKRTQQIRRSIWSYIGRRIDHWWD